MMNAHLIDGLPAWWSALPCRIEISFSLTDYNSVNGHLYKEYERHHLGDAINTFIEMELDDHIFVNYRVHSFGVIPAFEWYVDWPLWMSGDDEGIRRRGSQQGTYPWEQNPEDTLMELRSSPVMDGVNIQASRLIVGGRTFEDAKSNWHQVSRVVRDWVRLADDTEPFEPDPWDERLRRIKNGQSQKHQFLQRYEGLSADERLATIADPQFDMPLDLVPKRLVPCDADMNTIDTEHCLDLFKRIDKRRGRWAKLRKRLYERVC